MSEFKREDVEILKDELGWGGFFKLRALTLRHRLFQGGWGKPVRRELMERRPAVGLLPYDPQLDSVLLIEQFRVGGLERSAGPWMMELVAGLIDKDEGPEEVARREAVEEAGLDIAALESVANYFSSPGGSDEYFYLFCGRCDLSRHDGGCFGLPEEGEDIRVHIMSADAALNMMAEGHIDNAHTIIALQWLQMHRGRLRSQWQA